MTKIESRKVQIELRLADLRDGDGQEVSVGQGHMELRLRSPAMRGLRLLIHGMRAIGGDVAKKAAHKSLAVEYLLAKIAETHDKQSKQSTSGNAH